MLAPKRSKHRKAHKGRVHGLAKGGTTLNFGAFGMQAVDPGRITARQLEAARRTITVLLQASLTTTPWRTRLGMLAPSRGLRGRLAAPLAENGLDAGDVAPYLAHPRGVFELTAGALETQVEDLLAEGIDLLGQLVLGAGPQISGCPTFHDASSSPGRVTKRVAIGNFAAAKSNASRAI